MKRALHGKNTMLLHSSEGIQTQSCVEYVAMVKHSAVAILKYASRYDKKGTARRDIMKTLRQTCSSSLAL